MAIGQGGPENEVKTLRQNRTVCRSKHVETSKPIRAAPQVQLELAFFKGHTELRAIAAVVPTWPGLGGLGLWD